MTQHTCRGCGAVLIVGETTLDKWTEYEQPLDRVLACCNTMRAGINNVNGTAGEATCL